VDAPAFDLSDHVRVVPLPAPGAQLLLATDQLRRRRLDRSRPLREMCFLPGLPEERIGMFVKMHHAIADGIAGVATVGVPRRARRIRTAMDTGTVAPGTRSLRRQPYGGTSTNWAARSRCSHGP